MKFSRNMQKKQKTQRNNLATQTRPEALLNSR